MVGHADLGLGRLGQGRASGEGGAGTDVVLEVSVKLGLCGGVMHNEESETKSFGVSGGSGCRRESQESDAGVRGRGLKALGFGDI